MNIIKQYADKLYLKQWGIGLLRGNIDDIIRHKRGDLSFNWMPLIDKSVSHADPFVFRTDDGRINILFEKVNTYRLDGKISLIVCDDQFNPVLEKVMLDTKSHLSYPSVFRENGKIYVFPESAFSGSLSCYEFDQTTLSFINKQEVIRAPLLDSTILKYGGKYWIFATMRGKAPNGELHIFYADALLGPYKGHAANPVKSALNGSRPAGNFIEVDGSLYRPAQNCETYYGESITINKLAILTPEQYKEEEYMLLEPNMKDEFNYGIHTINVVDDIIVVDGQKSYFEPARQLRRRLKRAFG